MTKSLGTVSCDARLWGGACERREPWFSAVARDLPRGWLEVTFAPGPRRSRMATFHFCDTACQEVLLRHERFAAAMNGAPALLE